MLRSGEFRYRFIKGKRMQGDGGILVRDFSLHVEYSISSIEEEEDMRFEFRERKAAQAAAFLLSLNRGRMNYMKLIKLMYLADRQSLIETGQPITGDRMVSMPNGPVLSMVLDAVNSGKRFYSRNTWHEYISTPEKYAVRLNKNTPNEADYDELSPHNIGVLRQIFAAFGKMTPWALVRYTHTLPEWINPRGSSRAIDPATILRESGKSDTEIERVAQRAEANAFLELLESRIVV
jgi:uncharacterized phage-associated protein